MDSCRILSLFSRYNAEESCTECVLDLYLYLSTSFLQVELEKLYDKHDKTQMELRKAHGELEKFKSETAALEAEVDRFAGRIGKYQENEDKLNEDLTRYNLIIIWNEDGSLSYFVTNHLRLKVVY